MFILHLLHLLHTLYTLFRDLSMPNCKHSVNYIILPCGGKATRQGSDVYIYGLSTKKGDVVQALRTKARLYSESKLAVYPQRAYYREKCVPTNRLFLLPVTAKDNTLSCIQERLFRELTL